MKLKTELPKPPAELLGALEHCPLHYSTAVTVFHLLQPYPDLFCGVFGDGENGAYEWFTYELKPGGTGGRLETSDCAYGQPHIALRDMLNHLDAPEPAEKSQAEEEAK